MICSILCWHVIEWLYQEFLSIAQQYPKLKDFQIYIKQQCPSLSYIQDIANCSKHNGINKYTPVVGNTNRHTGGFSPAFNKGFDVDRLMMELNTGVEVFFDNEIEKANKFIRSFFQNQLNVNV